MAKFGVKKGQNGEYVLHRVNKTYFLDSVHYFTEAMIVKTNSGQKSIFSDIKTNFSQIWPNFGSKWSKLQIWIQHIFLHRKWLTKQILVKK